MKTLIVNLFGGPGAGKSAFSHGIMWKLKSEFRTESEMAPEYAKDIVFEDNPKKLENQIYIFGKQHNRVHRLREKVSVIVTDSPILLSIIYDKHNKKALKELILDEYKEYNTLNIVINRTHEYSEVGRYQKEAEALKVHEQVIQVLNENEIIYHQFDSNPPEENLAKIMNLVMKQLHEL